MNVYYLFDPTEQQRLNSTGEDYSPVYLKALAIYLGITAMPIAPMYLAVQGLELIKIIIGVYLVKKGVWVNNIIVE